MKEIKQIRVVEEPGFFSQDAPTIYLRVNEDKVVYEEVYKSYLGRKEPDMIQGPYWTTKTNSFYFERIKDHIEEVLTAEGVACCDGFGVIYTIEYADGTIIEKYLALSLFDNHLDELGEAFRGILKGLELPSFVRKHEDYEEDFEEDVENND